MRSFSHGGDSKRKTGNERDLKEGKELLLTNVRTEGKLLLMTEICLIEPLFPLCSISTYLLKENGNFLK